MSDFIHKPKKLAKFDVKPGTPEWDRMWAAAQAQSWWTDSQKMGYVGHDGEFWYFQNRGTTTGFARLVRVP